MGTIGPFFNISKPRFTENVRETDKPTVYNTLPMKSFIFCDIMPSSLMKVNKCFRGTNHLPLELQSKPNKTTAWAYSLTLKIEAMCFSERSIIFYWATRHYIPEEITLNGHGCENLKSNKMYPTQHFEPDSLLSIDPA
jgi:hypothetical protein